MTGPGCPHVVTGLTTSELDQARRELAASLALSRPGSPSRAIIATHTGPDAAGTGPRPSGHGARSGRHAV